MGKLKFTLSNILFWLAIGASCLLLENVAFLSSNLHNGLNSSLFFMLFTMAMVGYISFFVIEHIKNKVSIDFLLYGVFAAAIAGGMVAIWTFTDIHMVNGDDTRTFDYALTNWDKITQTLSFIVFIFTVYSIVFFFNKNYPSIRKVRVIFVIIALVCYAASIYSLVAEIDKIVYNLSMPLDTKELVSIFWNTNMFCGTLLMGILACIGLNYFKKNVFSYISILFFEVMILFCASITSTLVSLVVVVVYFLLEIIITLTRKQKRGFVFLAIYLFIVVGFILLFASSLKFNLGSLSNFFSTVYNSLKNANYKNFSNRTFIWDSITAFISRDTLDVMFGYGFRNSNFIIGGFTYMKNGGEYSALSAHSGYMQVLMNFGVVGVVIYAAFIFYYFYSFIRVFRKEPRFALLFALIGISMLVYGSMESVFLFNPNTQGILVGTAFFLPMVNKWKHFRRSSLGDDTLEVEKPEVLKPNLICQSLAKLFMGLAACLVPLYAFTMFREHIFFKYLILNIIVILLLCALTIPFIVSCLSIKRTRKKFIFFSVLNILLIGGAFSYLIFRYYMNDTMMMENAKWIYIVLLTIVLVGECIFFGTAKRQTFKDYAYTLLGMSKNSFMGLIGIAGFTVGAYFLSDKIEIYSNPLTLVVYVIIALMIYFLFSYFVPFKDQKEIVAHYNSLAIYDLKRDVVFDRLGVINEKHRD